MSPKIDRVSRRTGGFSYAEALLATLIFALCAELVCSAMVFGVRHVRERTKRAHAVILLDTLRAAVRNDLEYAKAYYHDNSFVCEVRGSLGRVRYDTEDGRLVRKIRTDEGVEIPDPVVAPESYSGYGEIGGELRVALEIELEPKPVKDKDKVKFFRVFITLCDGLEGENILTQTNFVVIPVTPIPYKDEG
ncbi:MAG: hypothetical protein IKN96_06760 [Oscillibacter sp.]|nr:hypothetical protein [Oscillibacter sp.]